MQNFNELNYFFDVGTSWEFCESRTAIRDFVLSAEP